MKINTKIKLSPNSFNRIGYTFVEWNTLADGSGDSYTDEQEIIINNDLTLYAQWEVKQYKIVFEASEEDLKVVRERADKRLILNTHSGEFMGMRHTEVIQTGFDKGNGVEMLLLHFNISKENSIGFGDSMNDVDMFKNVGYSVAMGNCAPKLRELADFVPLPVWDDGLKKALEKLELI